VGLFYNAPNPTMALHVRGREGKEYEREEGKGRKAEGEGKEIPPMFITD